MKRLITILLFLLMVVAALETVLPKLVSDAVAQGMRDLTGSSQVVAKVDKSPAVFMLGGTFDQVAVDADDVKVDKLAFRHMHIVLTDVALDIQALLSRRTLVLERIRDIDLTATITQEELAAYLNSSVKGVKNATVAIMPGKVVVSSVLTLGGFAHVDVKLEGRIVSDQQKIKFITERFWLNNTPVGNIGGAMLTDVALVDLKKLPFGVTVRDIVMEQGQVVIYTDNHPR